MKCFPFILLGLEILVLGTWPHSATVYLIYISITTHDTTLTTHSLTLIIVYTVHCALTLYTGCFAPLQSLYPT